MKCLKYRLIQPLVLVYIVCSGYIQNNLGASTTNAATLVNGVTVLKFEPRSYPPIKLSVFGDDAVVLATALMNGNEESGQSPIVACTTMKNGNRIVVFGYPTFATVDDTDSKKFLSNILNWMLPGIGPYNLGITGSIVLNASDNSKFKQMPLNLDYLSQYSIIVVDDINTIDDTNLEKLKTFLESTGKGLIVGISAYYMDNLTDEFLRNKSKVIGPSGILFTNIWNYMSGNSLEVNQDVLPTTHVSYAVTRIRSGGDIFKRYARLVAEFIRYTVDDPLSVYLRYKSTSAPRIPTDDVRILLTDVNTIQFMRDGWAPPYKLTVFGPDAKVLASALRNDDQEDGHTPIVACSTTENGNKIVVFGYRTFLEGDFTDSKKFVSNILNWMSPGNGPFNVGILRGSIALNSKDNSKFKQVPLDLDSLSQYDIVVVDDINSIEDINLEKLKSFLELTDKGMIVGISSFYKGAYINEQHMIKKSELIGPSGIIWPNIWNDMKENILQVNQDVLPTTHVSYAVTKIRSGDDTKRYTRLVAEFIRSTEDDFISVYLRYKSTSAPRIPTDDVGILLTDVNTIQFVRDGWAPPYKLTVFGPDAKVLASALRNDDPADGHTPIVACSTTENGNKIVIFGYRTFLEGDFTDSKKFVSNILNWMSPGNGPFNVGILRGSIALNSKDNSKFKQVPLDLDSLSQYDIVVVDDINSIEDINLEKLKSFLELTDKGMIVGISSFYKGAYITEKHMEKKSELIGPSGIFWPNIWNDMKENILQVNQDVLPTTHILYAFNKYRNGDTDQKYVRLIREYMRSYIKTPPPPADFMSRLIKDYRSGKLAKNRIIPSTSNQITDEKAKQRIRIESDIEQWIMKYQDPESILAHPASFFYPGMEFTDWGKPVNKELVVVEPVKPVKTFIGFPEPSANFNVCQKVDVRKAVPLVVPPKHGQTDLWYPTGMYARPGEVVTLQFPMSPNLSQIKVRIGQNTDDMSWNDEPFLRFPKIDAEVQVVNTTFKIASAFGGLMYIILPIDYNGKKFTVQFSGSYRATSYIFGKTTKSEWQKIIAKPEAPWGDLISKNVVDLMVPTEHLKKMGDPKDLLTEFNNGIKGLKYFGDLEIIGAETYTPDVRKPGWGAHSGYPIVYLYDYLGTILSAKRFCSLSGAWMWWHETGHNVQNDRLYISEKSGEITNNFCAAYYVDTYCNLTVGDIVVERSSDISFAWWETEGRPYSKWNGDYDLQFLPFLHLADKYGWESMRKLHQFYNKMRVDGDTGANVPDTYSQRLDLLYVVYSQIVGEDLSAYFKEWSVPLSQQAKECVKGFGLNSTSLQFCSEYKGTPGVQKTIGFNC